MQTENRFFDDMARVASGALATTLVGFRASSTVEPFLGAGVEALFGTTPVIVDGVTVATIPPVRVTADAGLRLRF